MSNYVRYITLILVIFVIGAYNVEARKSANLRNQRRGVEQKALIAKQRLEANREALRKNLNEVDLLDAEVNALDRRINQLTATSDSLTHLIVPLTDSLNILTERLDTLKNVYGRLLRRSYRNRSDLDELSFIFSSSSFSQAWRRAESLKQFSSWRKQKSAEIVEMQHLLEARRFHLDSLSRANSKIIADLSVERKSLNSKKIELDKLIKQLEKSTEELEREVNRRNKEMADLDDKISRALDDEEEKSRHDEEDARNKMDGKDIAEDITPPEKPTKESTPVESVNPVEEKHPDVKSTRKPAEKTTSPTPLTPEETKKLTARFENAKGKLSYPVKGKHLVVKKFGRQRHPRLPKVYTENAGIDIETEKGAEVFAVFEGEVSQIFKIGGYNNVIVIRHGDYVTVYANIVDLMVAKGDRVEKGQSLGHVYFDSSDKNRSILHFELRHEKDKHDPELWLK